MLQSILRQSSRVTYRPDTTGIRFMVISINSPFQQSPLCGAPLFLHIEQKTQHRHNATPLSYFRWQASVLRPK